MRLPNTLAPICLLGFILAVNAFISSTTASMYGNTSNASSLPVNTSSNTSLLPPYYRNGTTGTAWILPASPLDLGARAMTCECFDPAETCCMPPTASDSPFCVPQDAKCCRRIACDAGEICCDNYCCRSDTTCSNNPQVPGCCPQGQICNEQITALCLEYSSPKCNGTMFSDNACCPKELPVCRSQDNFGFGCFSTNPPASSTPSPTSTSPASTTTSYKGTTTLAETLSVSCFASNGLSLEFPETLTLPPNLAGWSIATTYVLSFPSTIFNPLNFSILGPTSSTATSPSSPKPHSSSTSQSTTKTHPTTITTSSSSTISSPSPLCWNPILQSPGPCTTSTSHPDPNPNPTPTTSTASPYPAATTLHSSSASPTRTLIPTLYTLLTSLLLTYAFIHTHGILQAGVGCLWVLNLAARTMVGRRGLAGGNGAEVGGQVRGKGKKMPGPFEWKRMLDEQEKVGKECVADSLFEGEGGVAAAARGGG